MSRKTDCLWKDRRHILWFPITFDKYRVENGRLYCQHGLFSQREHECLLYRILDISLTRTLGNRICGTGTITLQTTDSSDPVLVLKNIKDSRAVKDLLSDLIEKERVSKGIAGREIMVNSGMGEDFDGDGEIDFDDYR
ncbi:MAG TPA: PH domain-containing protein [Firmicutes bacterium]|nr:PH domain-containing protein [Bacillota bacterium]